MAKNLLFITRHAPYGNSLAREALDAVLAAAAYGQNLSLLFMDEGVFQLLGNQKPEDIDQKNLSAQIPVLPLYEVENIYVHAGSLQERGLVLEELILDAEQIQLIDDDAVASLMGEQDQLLSF